MWPHVQSARAPKRNTQSGPKGIPYLMAQLWKGGRMVNCTKSMLFSTEMVQALLEGRKSVTRRHPFQMPEDYNMLKGLYRNDNGRLCALFQCQSDPTTEAVYCRYDQGVILWVREPWQFIPCSDCQMKQKGLCSEKPTTYRSRNFSG